MPSERMDSQGLPPSSFFSEQLQFADERPLGFWKRNAVPNYGVPSSPLGKQITLEAPIGKSSDFLDSYPNQDLGANFLLEKHVAGVTGAASRSLPRALDHEFGVRPNFGAGSASYSMKGVKLDLVGAQRENSLFSSSLSELFNRRMRLSSSNSAYGHSVGTAASQYEEEETVESLKELEAQTIGNLLPGDDDDDLLPGVTKGIKHITRSYNGDDTEDLDVFSNVGGMDLGDDKDSQRTVVVLDSSLSSEELHKLLEVYGEIKEIRETPHRKDRKFIEFYDVRVAKAALCALKLEPSFPGGGRRLNHPFPAESNHDDISFHLPQMSPSSTLNTRLSGTFSHGGNASNNGDKESIYGSYSANGSALSGFVSSSVPNNLASPIRVGSVGHQSSFNEFGHSHQGERKFDFLGMPNFHPHSVPDFQDRWNNVNNGFSCNSPNRMSSSSLTAVPSDIIDNQQFCRVSSNGPSLELNESVFGPGNGSCPPARHHHMWNNNTHYTQPQGMMRPNSPSFLNGICTPHPQQLHTFPRSPNQLLTLPVPLTNHHVGSAPSANHPSLWDRRHGYPGESGSLENARISGNSSIPLEYFPNNVFADLTVPSKNAGFISHPQRCMVFPGRGQMMPVMNAFGSPNERIRNRRNDSFSSQVDTKKQFELDIDRIARGDDKRTTLMIKNIPNKYTSKMLLAAIDERHRGTYDFIYLPIDFKNKCNVGYAFINMTDPSFVIPFYQAFNGMKWEKFNSEKVAFIAYARIQGKAALIAHFQNSSLMNEDKRCRPILFHTDGPNAGDQVPFPMGANIRPRFGKNRGSTNEDNNQENPLESD